MMTGRRCLGMLLAVLSATSLNAEVSSASRAAISTATIDPTEDDMNRISELLDLAQVGQYPGTPLTQPGKHGTRPIWSQRTAVLYYHRKQAGLAAMWMTLALGKLGNAKEIISNKKLWMDVWEEANPTQFAKMTDYLPRTWVDAESFEVRRKTCGRVVTVLRGTYVERSRDPPVWRIVYPDRICISARTHLTSWPTSA